jgi:hypothetical protein
MILDHVKDMLEAIHRINEHCHIRNCDDCVFRTGPYECQMEAVADSLDGYPVAWDMSAIDRIERKLKL